MRRSVILTVVLLAFASTAMATTATVKIPLLLSHQIAALHDNGIGPILLPETMPSAGLGHLYPSVDMAGAGYSLDLGAAPGCHGAAACFRAEFSARHGRIENTKKVALSHGVTGWYRGLACGASCSAPSVEFKRNGFVYYISAIVGTEKTAKGILISMANSAIDHGAR